MKKSSQIAWKIVPFGHFFSVKVVPFIEVLLYTHFPAGERPYARQRPTKGVPLGTAAGVVPMDTPDIAAPTPHFGTDPYFGGDVEAQGGAPDISGPTSRLGYLFKRQRAINWSAFPPLPPPLLQLSRVLSAFVSTRQECLCAG
jgi:hypothetical protein